MSARVTEIAALLFALCPGLFAAESFGPPPAFYQARTLAEEGRYADAARVLNSESGLLSPEAKDLLAACLYLDGRRIQAVSVWNETGKPRLLGIEYFVPQRSNREFLGRVLGAEPGRVLEARRLATGLRVLRDAGVNCTVNPIVEGDGTSRLEVTLPERKGPFSSWTRFGVWSVGSAASGTARLTFKDIDGRGTSLGLTERWIVNRRMAEARLGFITTTPILIRHTARARFEERETTAELDTLSHQPNSIRRSVIAWEGAFPISSKLDLVLGVGRLLRWGSAGDDPFETNVFVQPVIGTRVTIHSAHDSTLTGEALYTYSSNIDQSASSFSRATVKVGYEMPLSARFRLMLGTQAQSVSSRAPADELVLAGVGRGSEMALPLRGHGLFDNGVAGNGPAGMHGVILQSTFSTRIATKGPVSVWNDVFLDQARLWDRVDTGEHQGWIFDGGLGLRLETAGRFSVGIRRGYSFTDHTGVWSVYFRESL